jgi:RNA polymerase sigma-70 factor (ECF subfamily)
VTAHDRDFNVETVIATSYSMVDEDQSLAQRAGEGDHAAFRVLFERYKAEIYRFCLLMLREESMAEDIYQEVFINFYRACRAGQQMHNVRGYLMTAARSRCINAIKSARSLRSLEDIPELRYEPDDTASETNQQLRDALLKIPEQYREAFLLFELEGYSYEEIAGQVGTTYDVVKNRIYRAKQSLQKILKPLLRDR